MKNGECIGEEIFCVVESLFGREKKGRRGGGMMESFFFGVSARGGDKG